MRFRGQIPVRHRLPVDDERLWYVKFFQPNDTNVDALEAVEGG